VEHEPVVHVARVSTHCWVLRRHPVVVGVFSGHVRPGPSNASLVCVGVVVVVVGSGCGGVLSVA
jgi:hypothetical protein